MQENIENNEFLETATFSGNMYGTSIQSVRNVQQQAKVCVLDIEIQGVEQIRTSDLNPILIFIMPPSIDELERRLTGRKSETAESLQQRLQTARTEMEYGLLKFTRNICIYHKIQNCTIFTHTACLLLSGQRPGKFHMVIHNNHVKDAFAKLRDFILKELETQKRQGININLNHAELKDD